MPLGARHIVKINRQLIGASMIFSVLALALAAIVYSTFKEAIAEGKLNQLLQYMAIVGGGILWVVVGVSLVCPYDRKDKDDSSS